VLLVLLYESIAFSKGFSFRLFYEIRKLLIVFKRRFCDASREPSCSECYREVLQMIEKLEARLEEYEYEEALTR